jgi:glycosyltransferase involved in cell wall biosynthesis
MSKETQKQELRILHVIETLDMGGAETVVANIVNNMSPGFRTDICCLMHSGPVAERIRPEVDIIELGKSVHGNDYLIPHKLARILKAKQIDIVQSHDWGTLLESVAGSTLAGVASVHMAHGPTIHYPANDSMGRIKKIIRRKAERLASMKVQCAIAVSEIVKKELISDAGFPAEKVVLIHNGIDLSPVTLGDLAAKRRQLNLSTGDFLLVTVGRLAEIKNYPLVLKALARARKFAPTLNLIMVGDGPERNKLEEISRNLGISQFVHFLGERKDVHDWLAISQAFVLPSFYEGISIALLEAMASGLTVIATRVGGNPEVIMNGINGYLVESEDIDGLSNLFINLAMDVARRDEIGHAARAHVTDKFDLKKTICNYEKIYMKIIGKKRTQSCAA